LTSSYFGTFILYHILRVFSLKSRWQTHFNSAITKPSHNNLTKVMIVVADAETPKVLSCSPSFVPLKWKQRKRKKWKQWKKRKERNRFRISFLFSIVEAKTNSSFDRRWNIDYKKSESNLIPKWHRCFKIALCHLVIK